MHKTGESLNGAKSPRAGEGGSSVLAQGEKRERQEGPAEDRQGWSPGKGRLGSRSAAARLLIPPLASWVPATVRAQKAVVYSV